MQRGGLHGCRFGGKGHLSRQDFCCVLVASYVQVDMQQLQAWLGSFTSPLNTHRLERRQSLHFKCLPCSINAVRRELCDGTMAEEALVLHRR